MTAIRQPNHRNGAVSTRTAAAVTLLSLLAWLCLVLSPLFSSAAPLNPLDQLFTASPAPPVKAPVHPFASRSRFVVVNHGLLAKSGPANVDLNVFDGVRLPGSRSNVESADEGKSTWYGSIDGARLSSAIFNVDASKATVGGTVRTLAKIYEISPVHGAVHVVFEIDPLSFPSEMEPKVAPVHGNGPASASGLGRRQHQQLSKRQTSNNNPVIDVMVVYTPQARIDAGGTTSILSAVNLAITETNDAYAQSNVTQRVRLVYAGEVNYVTAGFNTDLDRVTNPSDGYLDEVSQMREQYGADLVSLWITDTTYCGLGWLNTNLAGSSYYGYTVVSRTCATGYYSFAHEMGHNQGLMHDRANAGSGGAYPFSYGYQDPNNLFRTILAYNCAAGCPRIKYFSNPNLVYSGQPLGVDDNAVNSVGRSERAKRAREASEGTLLSFISPPFCPKLETDSL